MPIPRHGHLLALIASAAIGSTAQSATFKADIQPVLAEHCYGCHGAEKVKGDINLEDYGDLDSIRRNPKFWEKVVRAVQEGEMPPEDEPAPTPAQTVMLITWIEENSTKIDIAKIPKDPGHVVIRRLNRTEYNNTVRDLFGIKFRPGENFPADGAGGGGFDNNADTLFLPPILMEKYVEAADAVLDATFADPALKGRVFFVKPEGKKRTGKDAAATILKRFTSLAFRRHSTDAEVGRFLTLYKKVRDGGGDHEKGVRLALKAVMVSPRFLFRIEKGGADAKPYRIDDFELASRLSYFLWSSMPDGELLKVALQNKLRDPATLRTQVERMLDSPKAKQLAENFGGQWLGFDKMREEVKPDKDRFPEFDFALRVAMYQEPLMFFQHLIAQNRPVTELLHADYTFLNARLAKHYGLPGARGNAMQKVTLRSRERGGVLGMGATLASTSMPLRTSPVLRGRYVLDEILGTPPPPPPPDAGVLPADDRAVEGMSFRQQLEIHRRDPRCANCHERLDPIGFALENFDPLGRWRTEQNGVPVDSKGELPGGAEVDGPAGLKAALLSQRDVFVNNMAERLLAYSLGRGLEYFDRPTTFAVVKATKSNAYKTRSMIHAITQSYPFQYRRNP